MRHDFYISVFFFSSPLWLQHALLNFCYPHQKGLELKPQPWERPAHKNPLLDFAVKLGTKCWKEEWFCP